MPAIYDLERRRRDILLEEVEAGWYTVAQKPRCQKTAADDRRMAEYNRAASAHLNIVADAFALLSCPTPETGKSKFSPLPAFP